MTDFTGLLNTECAIGQDSILQSIHIGSIDIPVLTSLNKFYSVKK